MTAMVSSTSTSSAGRILRRGGIVRRAAGVDDLHLRAAAGARRRASACSRAKWRSFTMLV